MKQKKKKIKIEDVRASYSVLSMRDMPVSARWFGRPIADYLVIPFYNAGISANQLTIFRIFLYFGSLLSLFREGHIFAIFGAIGLLLAFIFDFADGHLARLNNNATYFGKYLDGIADYIFPTFLLVPLACQIDLNAGGFTNTLLALLCASLVLINRTLRERLRFFQLTLPKKIKNQNSNETILAKAKNWEIFFASHTANIRILLLFILFIPDSSQIFFYTMFVSQFILESGWMITLLVNANQSLNIWKKSASAV